MKRLLSVLTVLVLLLSLALPAWADTALTSSAETQNLQKAYYNSDYAYLEDPDSVFSSLTLEEAIYLFRQEGNYLLLLGGSWCGNTTPVIGYIDQVAKEYGIDTIYNLDFRLDGTNRASHIRETNGASADGTVLPGSLYNYLYGELVTNYLVNLNDYVEYQVDTESALTYTDADGHFRLVSNDICIHFEISAPGYSKLKFDRTPAFPADIQLPDSEREYHQLPFTGWGTADGRILPHGSDERYEAPTAVEASIGKIALTHL